MLNIKEVSAMKRKKTTCILLVLCLTLFFGFSNAALAADIPVYVDGKAVAGGIRQGGSVYVPLRAVAENCGAKVVYDQTRRAVLVSRADGGYLELGADGAGGAVFRQGVTYLPLRLVGEWLNYQVDYAAGTVRLSKIAAAPQADTLALPAGNLNCNLLNNSSCVFWQGDIYYWQPLADSLERTGENAAAVARGTYRCFNVWQGELYAVYDGAEPYRGYGLYKLDPASFAPQEKILDGPLQYCKIQDGWVYFRRSEDGELFRRRLAGGEAADLGLAHAAEVVITDQHIFATVTGPGFCQLWQAGLDGGSPKLLTALAGRTAKLLDYADGYLYLTLDSAADATLWRMRQDGAELRQLSADGAAEACVWGGVLYYSRIECVGTDGESASYGGRSVWRMPAAGGAAVRVSPAAAVMWAGYDQPVIWDGRVFYRQFAALERPSWHLAA